MNFRNLASTVISVIGMLVFKQKVHAQESFAKNEISTASELRTMYDIKELPRYRPATSMRQVSSYDRTGMNDDGFSGIYSFVRRLPDSSLILFDAEGPGVINRIWTPTPTDDSLDFFIDDSTRAAFTIMYSDLFSGKVYPFIFPVCNNQLGGYYCYLPIAFSKRCIVRLRAKHTQFYQIGYRKFEQASKVKSFSLNFHQKERVALDSLAMCWSKRGKATGDFINAKYGGKIRAITKKVRLRPGYAETLLHVASGGRIVGIELSPASAFEGNYKDADLLITWDDEPKPAVNVPVADFFGYAFGRSSMQSLLVGTDGQVNYCYFPMPFDKSASIKLLRRTGSSETSLEVSATIYLSDEPRRKDMEGRFYANWNHDEEVERHKPHVFLEHNGSGHYVGTVMQARGLNAGMTGFFEGDDSTVVDGEMTIHGTGSEDYFNGGWYAMIDRWDGPYSLPLSGSLDYTLPFSRTGGYRLFLSDKIPFGKSIHHSIEHGPERNEARGEYTSVAFFYSDMPPQASEVPGLSSTTVNLPDTMVVYPQLLTFSTINDVTTRRKWMYNTGGHSIVFIAEGESGVRIDLREIGEGEYKLFLDYTMTPQGATFSLWQRQTPLTGWVDSYSGDTLRRELAHFANVTITRFDKTVTIRFRGKEQRKEVFLNRLLLVRNETGD